MGLRINTNIQSMTAQRSLSKVTEKQSKTMANLSSGSRINKAGDDAAGLAISNKLNASIRSMGQASRNANDGISMIQVAEGGMNEISNILVRLRELSMQSASDTVGEKERSFTDMEFQNLTEEVERISQVTTYNDTKLLTGEGDKFEFQVGANNDSFVDRISYDAGNTQVTSDALGVQGLSVSSKEDAQSNLEVIDQAIVKVNENRSGLGALQNRLQSTVRNLENQKENFSAAKSRISDADIAYETAALSQNNILSQAATSVLSQSNTSPQVALRLIG